MIASRFQQSCSSRCELVLALTCLQDPGNLVAVASRLAGDRDRTAVHLAQQLMALPIEESKRLSLQTLWAPFGGSKCRK